MSQYPSPYSTPQPFPQGYTYDPYGAYLAPARRVGILMIVLGSIVAIYSMCNGTSLLLLPAAQLEAQNRMFSAGEPTMSVQAIRIMGAILSVLGLGMGIAHIALAIPIRRGNAGAIVGGIVLTSILLLLIGLGMLLCAIAGLAVPPAFLGICVLSIPAAVLVLQLIWLFQARRAGGNAAAMQMQYQQQYWQYQQQQQMYGYGYAQQQPSAVQQPMQQSPPSQSTVPVPPTAPGDNDSATFGK